MEADKNDQLEDKYLLIAKADNVKHISQLLRAVNFKDVRLLSANKIVSCLTRWSHFTSFLKGQNPRKTFCIIL